MGIEGRIKDYPKTEGSETVREPEWVILKCRRGQEPHVAVQLKALNIDSFIPRYSFGGKISKKSLLPNYLFVKIDEKSGDKMLLIKRQVGVLDLVLDGARIPQTVVESIQHQLKNTDVIDSTGYPLNIGYKIKVSSGPLKDLEGVFNKSFSTHAKLQMILSVSDQFRLTINSSQVRKIDSF